MLEVGFLATIAAAIGNFIWSATRSAKRAEVRATSVKPSNDVDPAVNLGLITRTGAESVSLLSEKPGRLVFRLHFRSGGTSIAKIASSPGSRAAAGLFAEGQSLSYLSSHALEHAPKLLSMQVLPNGQPCLIRGDAAGRDLHRQISDLADQGKWPTVNEALGVLLAAAEATAALHERELVHGDLKPANVALDFKNRSTLSFDKVAVLIDFDSAQFTNSAASVAKAGTVGFSAPERYFATHPLKQSDVYSLGRVAGFLFTGRPGLSITNPRVPEPLQTVLSQATSHIPFHRQIDARSFLLAINDASSRLSRRDRSRPLDWPAGWKDAIEPGLTQTIFFTDKHRKRSSRVPSEAMSSVALAVEEVMRGILSNEELRLVDDFFDAELSVVEYAERTGIDEGDLENRLEKLLERVKTAIHGELTKPMN